MAKPTFYSQALADSICRRIIGGESLRAICNEDGMPATSSVQQWRAENAAFNEQYTKARQWQAETLFDEILEIADNTQEGVSIKENDDGYEVKTSDMLGHRELRIKTRQWILPRIDPKKYGDKAQVDHTSSDGTMTPMSEEAVATRLTAIHKAAMAKVAAKNKRAVDDGSDLV